MRAKAAHRGRAHHRLDVTIQAQILDLIDIYESDADGVVLITHDMESSPGEATGLWSCTPGKSPKRHHLGALRAHAPPVCRSAAGLVPKIDQDPEESLLSIPGLPPDLSQTITNCRFPPLPLRTEQCRQKDRRGASQRW